MKVVKLLMSLHLLNLSKNSRRWNLIVYVTESWWFWLIRGHLSPARRLFIHQSRSDIYSAASRSLAVSPSRRLLSALFTFNMMSVEAAESGSVSSTSGAHSCSGPVNLLFPKVESCCDRVKFH